MAEGMFPPNALPIPGLSSDRLCAALVRIVPRTHLVLDLAPTRAQAQALNRNESSPDGSEIWYRYFCPEDLEQVDDPLFSMGMVRHELCEAVKAGVPFPQHVPLKAPGTGFAISAAGHVLTNYHLVQGEIQRLKREDGVLHHEARCTCLEAQIARQDAQGHWRWETASAVYLVSNPPTARAIRPTPEGGWSLAEDTALLRIEAAPSAWLELSDRGLELGEPVWMAGFPLRTARSPAALQAHAYTDADGSLRVSSGQVTGLEGLESFRSDVDGSMGNSGSPVFDRTGRVVGLFSRATGDGPRNAIAFGHMERVQVTSALAMAGLELASLLERIKA